jgi:hypothetical protein
MSGLFNSLILKNKKMKNEQTELFKVVVRSNAKFRYLAFLKDVNLSLKDSTELSFNGLAEKHKVARGLMVSVLELKIMKKISPRNFKWIGKRPSLEMANDILNHQRARTNARRNKEIFKPVEEQKVITDKIKTNIRRPMPVVKEKTVKISILWGLININKVC